MSRLTVSQIMQAVAATVNQESVGPSATSAEHSLWLEFINRGIREWSEATDWEVLKKIYRPSVTGTSFATVSLPADYKKLSGSPKLYTTGGDVDGEAYPEILDEESDIYISTDKYITETGDASTGYALVFHPGTLCSGASLAIPYYSVPTSLASPNNQPLVQDSEFLIDRTIAYIFEARSDPRFQGQEAKARQRLLMMIEDANLAKYSSYSNPNYVGNGPLKKFGFRIGRN